MFTWLRNRQYRNHDDVNVRFYADSLRCAPDDVLISELHETYTDHMLEVSHGYIQCVCPRRTPSRARRRPRAAL